MSDDWPFEAPTNLAVVTLRQILEGHSSILHVSHDEEDGGWQFLGGEAAVESDARIVSLGSIVIRDPSTCELWDLPEG